MKRACFIVMGVLLSAAGMGATFYVNATTGNDGVASANGYAYTAATKTVGKVGAFALYTYHAGDQLQITVTGTSSKADVGFYTIAGKTSDDAITLTTDASGTSEDDANVTLVVGNNGTTATTAAGSLNGPKKTISAAYDLVSTGDIIQLADGNYDMDLEVSGARLDYFVFDRELDVTIQGNAANRAAVTLQSKANAAEACVRGFATGTNTLKNLTINSTDVNYAIYADESTGGSGLSNMVLDNVVINQSNATSSAIHDAGLLNTYTSTRTWLITNCDINNTGTDNNFGIYCRALAQFIIKDTTIDVTAAGTGGGFFIESSAVSGTSPYVVDLIMDNVDITVTAGTFTFRNLGSSSLYFNDCKFYMGTGTYCVHIGNDGAVAANAFGDVYIANSEIKYTGAAGGHTLLIGPEAAHPLVYNCEIYSPAANNTSNIGLIIKSAATLIGNYVEAEVAVLLKGGTGFAKIINNTFRAHGTTATSSCLEWGNVESAGTTYIPDNCYICDNIFLAENGAYCLYFVDLGGTENPATGGNNQFFDNNVYYGDVFLRDGVTSTSYSVLTGDDSLAGYWNGLADKYYGLRDTSSITVNPSLDADGYSQNSRILMMGAGRIEAGSGTGKNGTLGLNTYDALGNLQ